MNYQTKALLVHTPKNVLIQEMSMDVPSDHDLIVQVKQCGVCTPEQRSFKGHKKGYPYWGGHELYGTVVEKISASHVNVGDRVVVALMDRCGKCYYCQNGLDNHCAYVNSSINEREIPGPAGFSSLISIPNYKAFLAPKIPNESYLCLVEPTACVMRSVQQATPKNGNIGIIGGGTMGLIHAIVCKTLGYNVFLFEDHAMDEKTLEILEISESFSMNQLSREGVMNITNGEGISAFFCTRHGTIGIEKCIDSILRGGDIILFQSLLHDKKLEVDFNKIHYEEIRLKGTIAQSSEDIQDAISLVGKHYNLFDALSIAQFDLVDAQKAMETALNPSINRVLINFNEWK